MLPHEIEQESFRIIRSELGPHAFSPDELSVVVRVIHATGDFDFLENMRFHPQAIASGVEALRGGCTVVTDVRMVQVGIASTMIERLGCDSVCDIQHPGSPHPGREVGAGPVRRWRCDANAGSIDGGIAAIGNAPTALLEVIRLVREDGVRPALVIGVPVGFVSAVESKDALLELGRPVHHRARAGKADRRSRLRP